MTSMDFPSNSQYSSAPDPDTKKEVTAVTQAVVKPPSPGRKVLSSFFAEDVKQVGSYVVWDVILPTVKNLVADVVTGSVERAIFGDVRTRPRGSSAPVRGYTSYSRMYQKPDDSPGNKREISRVARMTHRFDEIVLPSRESAYDVLDNMERLLAEYGKVTVGDFYDLVGVTPDHPDENYGWTSIRNAVAVQTRDGYIIDIPPPRPLRGS